MNRILTALALIALPVAASAADLGSRKGPAAPQPVFTSFDAFISAGAGYGWSTGKISPDEFDLNGLALESRATFFAPINGTYGVQADGEFSRRDVDFQGTGFTTYTGSLAAHGFTRTSAGLVGLFVQGDSNSDSSVANQSRRYFAGVDGQYFMGNTTLYGQVAYQSQQFVDLPGTSFNPDGVNVALQARNFITPDLMVAVKGEYQYLSGSLTSITVKQDAWRLGTRGEYRFAATPYSVYGDLSYQQSTLKAAGMSYKENDTRAVVGLKVNFGSKTLLERDRSGASLDTVRAIAPNAPIVGLLMQNQ